MVVVACPVAGCQYITDDLDPSVVTALLQLHTTDHRPSSACASGPKLIRPRIDIGVSPEVWNAFVRRWEAFRTGSYIANEVASIQLFQCAENELADLMLRTDHDITSKSVTEVLSTMRTLAVVPVARGVIRADLMQMRQANDESFRLFAARVRGKAETCGFTTVTDCLCKRKVTADYTEEAIRDVLLAGVRSIDIRREALSAEGLQQKSVNDIIAFIEAREMASKAASGAPETSFAAVSSFKRAVNGSPHAPKKDIHNRRASCPDCGSSFQVYKRGKRGWNTKPFEICYDCWRNARKVATASTNGTQAVTAVCASQISVLRAKEPLGHQVFDGTRWRKSSFRKHPLLSFKLAIEGNRTFVHVDGVADTGAQTNMWGYDDFISSGFADCDLQPVNSLFCAADRNPIIVLGAFKGIFEGSTPCGQTISSRALVYVSKSISGFFLSQDTMLRLRVIDETFPKIGGCTKIGVKNYRPVTIAHLDHEDRSCNCPQRSAVPDRPMTLPFEPHPKNIAKMQEWLLKRYESSTFNICPHRPLQQMAGPPIQIHMDDSAVPKVCHTAASIPLHWQERVMKDLRRDEALGVIERVPYGTPVTWCHRMVVTRKQDGAPRRTVDLSPLNKYCRRESFSGESPFILARRVAGQSWKSVADAWNGYHSVPLRRCDRHLTTFITPFGRYRYTRAPQEFLSSGDGYNRRFDAILSSFVRKERCVDDTIFYDEDLGDHWWRTIDFLSTVGSAGIVLNPAKFQFCQREVNFAGFRITDESIEPLPKYIDAIRSFPTPQNRTDIRSWFGLINQVSSYAQLRDLMAPFRQFLSPKSKFFWDQKLNEAFLQSKDLIIEAIREGVRIFDVSKPTCLRPDWSRRGIGYFLLQKHCACTSELPNCCSSGWKITLAGSRFLSQAESRYAAVEGEALAIAWGLENTRYFTQGCDQLIVVTDHKPLVKIFGDRTLDEISNTRLFRLKQRSLPWHFRVAYLPGNTNAAADAASRYPNPASIEALSSFDMCEESRFISAISSELQDIMAISWALMAKETSKDPILCELTQAIREGFVNTYSKISPYMRYKDCFFEGDEGVIFYKDRVVVPSSLRRPIIRSLHSAHQGVSSMECRAQAIIFWPGMTYDIRRVREECYECNRNAPSQAAMPTEPINPPSTPFQQIFADYFGFAGHHFLVIGDRLSGWSEIYSSPSGTQYSGAKGLIRCLRSFFSTFGVPEEIASDGGPEFMADTTKTFLNRWDVRHRVSSAYYPQSNGRAEVAVKSCKRLLRSNIGPNGSLNNDQLLRAMLQLRNTPDPDCKLSPAEIVFGRPLKDAFAFCNRSKTFNNPAIRSDWRSAWSLKELALRKRFARWAERHNERSRDLRRLQVGDRCFVQNQEGNHRNKWDRSGLVVDVLPYNKYVIKVDGSGRLTTRNRRFLRLYKPSSTLILDPLVKESTSTKPRNVQSNQPNDRDPRPYVDENPAANCNDESITVCNDGPSVDAQEGPHNESVNDESSPRLAGDPAEPADPMKRDPLAVRRLKTHIPPGLREDLSPITTRLRPRTR